MSRFPDRVRAITARLVGDRYGLLLWLGLLLWFGLTWRIGFFIQDSYATANALVALADGHLAVTELRYSISIGAQPGLHEYEGQFYGRNYGHLALAVPFVWALEGLAVVVDPRLLLAAIWSGVGLAFTVQASRLPSLDRDRVLTVGSGAVVVFFAASVVFGTDLQYDRLALVAFQLATMVAAATTGLIGYRLLALWHNRRIGLAGGIATGLATPVGFWASIPKRHALVGMLVLGTVYAFAVSKARTGRVALTARAAAYALAGLVAWVHAFEALFLVVTLAGVDVATASRTRPRDILVIGLVLTLAATPMLATNYAISGNPAQPPRLLPNVGQEAEFSPPVPDPDTGGGGTTATPTDGATTATPTDRETPTPAPQRDTGTPLLAPLADAASSALGSVDTITGFAGDAVTDGVDTLDEPERLYRTFVRSGHVDSLKYRLNDYETIDLAFAEALPFVGGLLAIPLIAGRRALTENRSFRSPDPRTLSPERKTDVLVAALAVVFVVVYMPRLPLFSQLTVRYLHPVVPLATYGVFRLPAVRAAVDDGLRESAVAFVWCLAAAVAIVLGAVWTMDLALGEAVQFHALLNLATATLCAITVVAATAVPDAVPQRAVRIGLALPAGFGAAYVLLAGVVYFRYGTYAFDVVRVLAGTVPAL